MQNDRDFSGAVCHFGAPQFTSTLTKHNYPYLTPYTSRSYGLKANAFSEGKVLA
jgi:hypothetical protein